MKKYLVWLLVPAAFALSYFFSAFVFASFNVIEWGIDGRFFTALAGCGMAACAVISSLERS